MPTLPDRSPAPVGSTTTSLLLVVGLLTAGLALGWALAGLPDGPASSDQAPRPLLATSPSLPIETSPAAEDPTHPALPVGLPLETQSLGSGSGTDQVQVPAGWRRADVFANETRWSVPDYPRFTFFLRIEQVASQHRSAGQMVEDRVEELSDLDAFAVVERGADSLHVSYRLEGHLRHVMLAWVDLREERFDETESAEVELEVALSGRESDLPGMRDLAARVAAGASDRLGPTRADSGRLGLTRADSG